MRLSRSVGPAVVVSLARFLLPGLRRITPATETLRVVVRTLCGQSILKVQSTKQRSSLAFDLLSLGSRAALGVSFLLSVSDRLGCYGNPGEHGVSWGTFERFLDYAAKVNALAPPWMIPFLGMTATALELLFGITLVLGLALRWAAFGGAGLLFLFGSAMAISFGIKSPFDYSVFAAMCCALFLGLAGSNRWTVDSLL
ncbi:DoxX family membrane protein [Bradyrhizobium sp. S3.2.12]|uniref:DoxX family membrane protein n=1 Tax=Bradyrhizobium sp. S3.2.12 TaxID=3156387 RepID=UPI00339AEA17